MVSYSPPNEKAVVINEAIFGRKKKGLIVIGYQGIGKSTAAKHIPNGIDLESSLFKIDNKRFDNWYMVYAKIAVNLARQGYIVFTSSHKEVVEEIESYGNELYDVFIICPHYKLQDKWVEKLRTRYRNDSSQKNCIAWKDAEENMREEVTWLASYTWISHILLENMNYNLIGIINALCAISRNQDVPNINHYE